jgi:hypothetical protein
VRRDRYPQEVVVTAARGVRWRAAALRERAEAQREWAVRRLRNAAQPAAPIQFPNAHDWICHCGQRYRVTETASATRLWPRTGFAAYSRHGLELGAQCVRCGEPLGLDPAS